MASPEPVAAATTYGITIEERAADGSTKTSSVFGEAPVAAAFLRAAADQMAPKATALRAAEVTNAVRFGTADTDGLPAEDSDDGRLLARVVALVGRTITTPTQWKLIEAIRAERPEGPFDPADPDLLDAVARRAGFASGEIRLHMARIVATAVLLLDRCGEDEYPALAAEIRQLVAEIRQLVAAAPGLAMRAVADAVTRGRQAAAAGAR